MTADEVLAGFGGSPDFHVHQVDLVAETALVVAHDAETYRTASFLDGRALVPGTHAVWIPLSLLARAASAVRSRPLHFVWHTGHVGSTLLSRLLGEVNGVLSLREPLPLRGLADAADALGGVHSLLDPSRFESLLATLCNSWARGYTDTRCVVVKATSTAARIASRLLQQLHAARSVYLNVRLEPYLATSLSRRPLDLRSHGPERIRRLQSRLTIPLEPLWSMSVGELAALSWLTETLTERDVTRAFGQRVLAIDFEAMLADVHGTMATVLDHLALSPDEDYLSRVESSHVLTRHSKSTDMPYSKAVRDTILDDSRARNRDEIRKGTTWLDCLARLEPSVADVLRT